jgi:hypothetical protein
VQFERFYPLLCWSDEPRFALVRERGIFDYLGGSGT